MAQADLEAYRQANSELSRLVKRDLAAFFASLNLGTPEAARDALLEFLPVLTAQYGDVAASLAAEFYEEMRAASGAVGAFTALSAPSVPAEAVQAKVRYLAGHLWTPEPDGMLGGLLTAADKYVKQPGRSTVAANAKREGVRWARVPTGRKTCSFCLVLASRDAVFLSKESAKYDKSGEKYHGHCDCEPVRIASAKDYPKDYLPDDYYDMYSAAAKADDPEVRAFIASLPADDKNKQIKAAAFVMRRNYPDAVRDGVHTH
jgi:hypothetical protein